MSYTGPINARIQYQGLEGAAAQTYFVAWLVTNADIVDESSEWSFGPLIPPHAEGCLTQLDLALVLNCDTYQEYSEIVGALNTAIFDGGVAQADCDSYWNNNRPE